jgi:TPR repeat protein
MVPSKLLLATALTASSLAGYQGLSAQELTTRCDPPPGSLERLTQAQKNAFMKSQDLFIAGHYAEALGGLRILMSQLPENTPVQRAMTERTAEAALEAGERTYVISLLKPIEERDSTDCPARTLLARAYAEDGKSAERDAEISALVELHKHAPKSPAGTLDAFLLERHSLPDGVVVTTAYFLRPWGPHNTHILSQIFDASGGTILSIELDSDDPDQLDFKETHPQLAAKGDRRYSLDVFSPNRTSHNGGTDHALIQFYDGRPSYDAVRERILAIAEHSAKLKSEPDPLEVMRQKADAGDTESSFDYALQLLRRGEGADVAVIERYAEKGPRDAAHQSDIAAAYERASFLDDATRRQYAMKWWKAVGGSRGYYQVAQMFYGKSDGTVTTDDEKQAVVFWQKSVAAGDERWARLSRMKLGYCVVKGWSSGNMADDAVWAHELAMEMLGKEYFEVSGEYSYGRELQHNEATHLHLVERAAIYNIDNAQGTLAHEIIQGNWKQRDDVDAYAWLKLQTVKQDVGGGQEVRVAEENPELKRSIEARYAQLLRTREESGAFYPQDDPLRTEEVSNLERRAIAPDPEAEFRLATLLEKRGREADFARAIALYHHLWAMAGQQVRLTWGRTLMYGTGGTTRDDIGAEKWLWDAANAGSKEACRLLAIIYGEGRGFKADPVAAEAWRELAGETEATGPFTDDQKTTVNSRVLDWKLKHPHW